MNEKIIKLEVKNYKKFDSLNVEGFGQINLITGDNNVGKTCLLEALCLNTDVKYNLTCLYHFLVTRGFNYNSSYKSNLADIENNQKNNVVGLAQKKITEPISIKKIYSNTTQDFKISNEIIDVVNSMDSEISSFAIKLERYPEINRLSKNWLLFYQDSKLSYMVDTTSSFYNQFLTAIQYIPLITLADFFRDDLIAFYNDAVQNLETKRTLIENLNILFDNDKIIDIQIRNIIGVELVTVATEVNPNFHPITNYGSGFVRIFRILLEIMVNKHKIIAIDEIDTGIHFLKMKEFWDLIFKLSLKLDIQIFSTTHSSDCIKAFLEASEENSVIKNKLRLIELEEFKSKSNVTINNATTYNYETFKFKIETNTNIRGGSVWQ